MDASEFFEKLRFLTRPARLIFQDHDDRIASLEVGGGGEGGELLTQIASELGALQSEVAEVKSLAENAATVEELEALKAQLEAFEAQSGLDSQSLSERITALEGP